jgi:hypothetical protein
MRQDWFTGLKRISTLIFQNEGLEKTRQFVQAARQHRAEALTNVFSLSGAREADVSLLKVNGQIPLSGGR